MPGFTEEHSTRCRSACRGLRAGRTSGVPQKVEVVPLCSMFSLQSPKSVKTMCPCESSRIFSGFKSLQEEMKEDKGSLEDLQWKYFKCNRLQNFTKPRKNIKSNSELILRSTCQCLFNKAHGVFFSLTSWTRLLTDKQCSGSAGSPVHWRFQQCKIELLAPGSNAPSGDGRTTTGDRENKVV